MKRRATAVFGRKGANGRRGVGDAGDGGTTQRDPRRPIMRPAQLLYCSGAAAITVTLRDLSSTGARIVAPRDLPPLDEFELAFDGLRRRCAVVWRGEGALGVRFV